MRLFRTEANSRFRRRRETRRYRGSGRLYRHSGGQHTFVPRRERRFANGDRPRDHRRARRIQKTDDNPLRRAGRRSQIGKSDRDQNGAIGAVERRIEPCLRHREMRGGDGIKPERRWHWRYLENRHGGKAGEKRAGKKQCQDGAGALLQFRRGAA